MKNMFCGTILIAGKTNVGKSTLFNKLIGNKISIISNRKNTTKKYILGVDNDINYQSIFIDTPGFNKKKYKKNKLKIFNKNFYIDIIILVIDRTIWKKEDETILKNLNKNKKPIMLVINKIDKIKKKEILLPFLQNIYNSNKFFKLIPISAKKKYNILEIKNIIKKKLPIRNHIFKKNFFTYNTKKFFISEIVRETFMHYLQQEVPYKLKIKIEIIKKILNKELYIKILIIVKNNRHKKIVIGKNGSMIKKCNIRSRIEIEKILKKKIHLYINVLYKKN
ncbi:GTPase Era [Buchnera aphidicola (Ceratovacuna keduensis)]|uniref:GTPase Era n=1 Tax=Buchnera aphidicola TaxID=9 RepID=UPI0031B88C28